MKVFLSFLLGALTSSSSLLAQSAKMISADSDLSLHQYSNINGYQPKLMMNPGELENLKAGAEALGEELGVFGGRATQPQTAVNTIATTRSSIKSSLSNATMLGKSAEKETTTPTIEESINAIQDSINLLAAPQSQHLFSSPKPPSSGSQTTAITHNVTGESISTIDTIYDSAAQQISILLQEATVRAQELRSISDEMNSSETASKNSKDEAKARATFAEVKCVAISFSEVARVFKENPNVIHLNLAKAATAALGEALYEIHGLEAGRDAWRGKPCNSVWYVAKAAWDTTKRYKLQNPSEDSVTASENAAYAVRFAPNAVGTDWEEEARWLADTAQQVADFMKAAKKWILSRET